MLLGILAGVAAPRLFSVSEQATENALAQTLSVVRDGIELHHAQTGELPAQDGSESTFKTQMSAYLRGDFPENPFKGEDTVSVNSSGADLTGSVGGSPGWLYDNQTGQFIANSNGKTVDGSRRLYEL